MSIGPAKQKVLLIYGTRPEAIKMAPLALELARSRSFEPVVAVTGQHRAMLDQVNALFGIVPKHDLDIITERQRLEDITARVLTGVSQIVGEEQPDAVVVQGDTTTCFAASLAAFYRQVPLVHLEAGLRTRNLANPFPEEANRCLTSQIAALHLAPTSGAKNNLRQDGIDSSKIVVTGNTVIDALLRVVAEHDLSPAAALGLHPSQRMVLVTTHRRESWGEPMARTARAVARLARAFPRTQFVLPAHLNPIVREVLNPVLSDISNVNICEPLDYATFAHVMQRASIVLTDSGGVQEEAPSFGRPVLVLRETTERPEAVEAGTVRLVGTDEDRIFDEARRLLTSASAYAEMAQAVNPYGDGHASERCVAALEHFFGLGDRMPDFAPIAGERLPAATDQHMGQ